MYLLFRFFKGLAKTSSYSGKKDAYEDQTSFLWHSHAWKSKVFFLNLKELVILSLSQHQLKSFHNRVTERIGAMCAIAYHSPFEMKKTMEQFLLGLWTCFRHYGWLLSRPRWKFLPRKYSNQVALLSFFQKMAEIKIRRHFEYKKPFITPKFCGRNFSQMHHFEDMNFLSPLDFLYLL